MASEYTPNYNLDLYTDNDKPNLRDQYNGAITKIDTQLHEFSNNMGIVTSAASQAMDKADTAQATASAAQDTANSALTKANENAAQIAQNTTTTFKAGAYLAVDEAPISGSSNLITSGGVHSAITDINTLIPNSSITTPKIADGAVTETKIAQSAKDAIIGGITIKVFGSDIIGVDNTGANYPDKIHVHGAYIPALDILMIWQIVAESGSNWSESNPVVLPSYVPSLTPNPIGDAQIGIGGIEWTKDNDFKTWHSIKIQGRNVYPTTANVTELTSVPFVIYCGAYISGDTTTIV